MHDHRVNLAQNFLIKPCMAASLLNHSSIDFDDVVYEIGPGKGILTRELVKKARRVIAIEKDYNLYIRLKERFKYQKNLVLYHNDFLRFTIRESRYKVFANIPFNITAAIVRKLVRNHNPPVEAYLIMQKEAAEKFMGAPQTTRFSVSMQPWFRSRIVWCFSRSDFWPVPNVNVVMFRIERRIPPLIPLADFRLYNRFLAYGFGAWRKNVKMNYRHVFSHRQWKRLSRDLSFDLRCRPTELSGRQWLGLFEFYRKNICLTGS